MTGASIFAAQALGDKVWAQEIMAMDDANIFHKLGHAPGYS
jgi:hypothetical protein